MIVSVLLLSLEFDAITLRVRAAGCRSACSSRTGLPRSVPRCSPSVRASTSVAPPEKREQTIGTVGLIERMLLEIILDTALEFIPKIFKYEIYAALAAHSDFGVNKFSAKSEPS